jgi:hypothetical protein
MSSVEVGLEVEAGRLSAGLIGADPEETPGRPSVGHSGLDACKSREVALIDGLIESWLGRGTGGAPLADFAERQNDEALGAKTGPEPARQQEKETAE